MNMQQRSGTPKVMGILMIIFASLGLLGSLMGLVGGGISDASGAGEVHDAVKTFNTMSMIFSLVGLGVSALHLVAGVNAVKYKAGAPKLSMMYGVIAIASQVLQGIIVFVWLKPKMGPAANLIGGFLLISIIFASIWPILVLVLMSRPGSKAACTN